MRFILFSFLLVAPAGSFAQSPFDLKTCAAARTQALRDAQTGKLQYYYFGIIGPGKSTIAAAKKLGVEAVSTGCVVSDVLECYNAAADSIVFATKKVRLWKLQ